MKSFFAFFKKEMLESMRSGKLVLLGCLFLAFGIMNPAIAKLTPWLMETLSDSMAESGMIITGVKIDAMTSWTQFFKNIPMALIVFVLTYSGIFTKEYESGTLVLVLTKGLSRWKVVLAKTVLMLLTWTVGYWLCYGVTYAYNAYFWDNSVAVGLLSSTVFWWLFGVWVIGLMVLFSTLSNSNVGVLLGTGGAVLVSYLIEFLPKIKSFMPTLLMNTANLLTGKVSTDYYGKAVIVTVILVVACFAVSIPLINKKEI